MSDDRKFKCKHPGCEKTFNRRDYLIRHSANHLDTLPFQCPQCPMKFARADLLQKHLNTRSHERRKKREEKEKAKIERKQRRNSMKSQSRSNSIDMNTNIVSPTTDNYTWLFGAQWPESATTAEDTFKIKSEFVPHQEPTQPDKNTSELDFMHMVEFEQQGQGRAFYAGIKTDLDNSDTTSDCSIMSQYSNSTQGTYPRSSVNMPDLTLPPHMRMSVASVTSAPSMPHVPHMLQHQPQHRAELQPPHTHLIQQQPPPPPQHVHGVSPEILNPSLGIQPVCLNTIGDLTPPAEPFVAREDKLAQQSANANQQHLPTPQTHTQSQTQPTQPLSPRDKYLGLFWSNFDQLYPIIHRPSFNPDTAPEALVTTMVCVGMTYDSEPAVYQEAIRTMQQHVHQLYSKAALVRGTNADENLWVLQALALAAYFHRLLGSKDQWELAEMYSCIALVKDQMVTENAPQLGPDIAAFWQVWIKHEARKRLLCFFFILDTQAAILFKHTSHLSVFDTDLELPCTDAAWSARDTREFYIVYTLQPRGPNNLRPAPDVTETQSYPKNKPSSASRRFDNECHRDWPSLLFCVKRIMSDYEEDQQEYPLACFSQFSRLLLLHGILNICLDLQHRMVSKKTDYKTKMVVAFMSWRGYFDRQLREINREFQLTNIMAENAAHLKDETNASALLGNMSGNEDITLQFNNYGNTPLLCSNWSLFSVGLMTLFVDTQMLRQYTGTASSPSERVTATLRQWANGHDVTWAVWYANQLLGRVFQNEALPFLADHVAWGMFSACLTLYTFESLRRSNSPLQSPLESISESPRVENTQSEALEYIRLASQTPPEAIDDFISESAATTLMRQKYIVSVLRHTANLLSSSSREQCVYIVSHLNGILARV
ncbi:YALIA101S07e01684g1_1 [Yarrowia lipolytica]|nr:YALIA101S07e01684g1_1 [Yarrowia lipolytica]VBB87688.1 Conserved hypothetical protein [Yarrowia lipolytica]